MNSSLVSIHRFLYLAALAGFVSLSLVSLNSTEGDKMTPIAFVFVVFFPLFLMHYFGAMGASRGKSWGRTLSRVVAVILLFGIPIGTVIGIYILSRTGKKWESES